MNNCTLTGNSADQGGGAGDATLNNCTLTGNSAYYSGGGATFSTLNNCTLTGNSAGGGGGAMYSTLNNCTVSSNSATLGGGASRSTLNNCTVAENSASGGGGGVEIGTLNNCTLTGNRASGTSGFSGGGGAAGGTLNNCSLTGNSTATWGGGVIGGDMFWGPLTLNNCTLTGNSASLSGGGALGGTLNNCIVYFNTATNGANYATSPLFTTLNYCSTTPMSTSGFGNITNAPLFVDYANGNLHLQSNSPCINAGLNAYAPGSTDLDGLPRIVSGTVDIGAYEFQGPGSVISYAWLQQYGLPTDGSADATDPDADGHTTWQEWRCQTDPTNALSVLRLLSATPSGTNVTVSWQSVAGVNYFLERSTNLASIPPFTPLATGIPGQPTATGAGR
ncbi:MAG: hypothetical protein HY298_12460 [Verrucomicrobia bacterium]|nr:hypothetical protein [Verrucomicrobiota bacterium]